MQGGFDRRAWHPDARIMAAYRGRRRAYCPIGRLILEIVDAEELAEVDDGCCVSRR